MRFPKGKALEEWQRGNPVVQLVYTNHFFKVDPDIVRSRLVAKGNQVVTWGRRDGIIENDPHFIVTKGGTGMHTDPGYPRYTHQLKLFVDKGICTSGISGHNVSLLAGLYYVLDTHSPHIVSASRGAINLSVSYDSGSIGSVESILPILIDYASRYYERC